jgi:hypothetical protein|eukprot:SAG25_NODE_1673_length_2573_cov_4.266370_2_plen_99_part_00
MLTNEEFGCAGVSYTSGPPSTLWSKPLRGGRTAILAINGADLVQKVDLNFQQLLGQSGAHFSVRNVWEGRDEPAPQGLISTHIGPHDCALYVVKKLEI